MRNYWVSDASFVTLFFILVFVVFAVPVLIDLGYDNVIFLNVVFIILFFIGIPSAKDKPLIILTSILLLCHIILKIIRFSQGPTEFYFLERIIGFLNLLVFIFINLRLLFRDSEVGFYRVIGAINVYLLIALLGAFAFEIIHITFGGGLTGNIEFKGEDIDLGSFLYYSMVSLTTVGYGDIYPNNMATKMFSVFLSAIGILFPAVVIAKLVSAAEK